MASHIQHSARRFRNEKEGKSLTCPWEAASRSMLCLVMRDAEEVIGDVAYHVKLILVTR